MPPPPPVEVSAAVAPLCSTCARRGRAVAGPPSPIWNHGRKVSPRWLRRRTGRHACAKFRYKEEVAAAPTVTEDRTPCAQAAGNLDLELAGAGIRKALELLAPSVVC
jgi:hypothetical protein